MENLSSNWYMNRQGSRDWTRSASFTRENRNPNKRINDNLINNCSNFDNRYNSYLSYQSYHAPVQKRSRVQFESTKPIKIVSYNRNPSNFLLFTPQLLNTVPDARSVVRQVRPTPQHNPVGSTTESNSLLPFLPSSMPINNMRNASLNVHGIRSVGDLAIKKPNSAIDARVQSGYGVSGEVRPVLQHNGSNLEPPALPSTMPLNAFHGVGPVGGQTIKKASSAINDRVLSNTIVFVQNQSHSASVNVMESNIAPVAVQGYGADMSKIIGSKGTPVTPVSSTNQYVLNDGFFNLINSLTPNTSIPLPEEKQKETQLPNSVESILQGLVCSVSPQIAPGVSQYLSSNHFSNLVSSLAAEGLVNISEEQPKQTPEVNKQEEKSEGVLDFNPEFLKTRHESVIRALYADIPRQCSACGQRFKSQEKHRNHMDWHVRKNRMKNNSNLKRKQASKTKPSRNWFASERLWLNAASGEETDNKTMIELLNGKNVVEKKDGDKEFIVPADEDQKICALCREEFENFFSDEADDWMYKGAVYVNVAKGKARAGMDRHKLGPIVHAKCMPETKKVTAEDFRGSSHVTSSKVAVC